MLQGVGVGIVRGTGRQTLGAVIIFVSYYVVALPVGVPLMFATSLGLAGGWPPFYSLSYQICTGHNCCSVGD